ncbi:MAG: DUF6602 domain-containing protein [Cellvibrionaceae bacterium]
MSNYISEVINSKIDFLKSSYTANKLVRHQGVKGNLNEILLLELIQGVIPSKYKFANGIIQDSNGFQSNESDIIIYNNEILPTIMFGNNLGFVPSESAEYIFEVKSTLNATELKSTIDKFSNLLDCSGYKGRNVLFSFSSDLSVKSELERYYENDRHGFFISPLIRVLMISGKGYYFFTSKKVYLKNLIGKNEFAKIANRQNDAPFKINETSVKVNSEADIRIKGDLIINGLNYDDLYVYIYRWYGTESNTPTNNCFLEFLSGVSNTLSQELFGKYLLSDCKDNVKIYSECIVDMWGNRSYQNIDFDGYDETNINEISYSVSLNETGKNNKIEIYPK